MRALKVARECYKELGYFKLMDDIDDVINANKHLLKDGSVFFGCVCN